MGIFKTLKRKSLKKQHQQSITKLIQEFIFQSHGSVPLNDILDTLFNTLFKDYEKSPNYNFLYHYDVMEYFATNFNYVPAMMWLGNYEENEEHNPSAAVQWYKLASDAGDGNGARCYADMLMVGLGVERSPQQALKHYALAAQRGIPEAMFVVGEFMRNSGHIEEARQAYQDAVNSGYAPAKIRLEQLERQN